MTKNVTLPDQSDKLFLTDGGLETTLIFLEGFELPSFAAFDLLKEQKGYDGLSGYYRRYLNIARQYKTGFVLESPTWRASPDWIAKLGYPDSAISEINRKAIQLMVDLKEEFRDDIPAIVTSGCVGPRGDGYQLEKKMTVQDARQYHSRQIEVFRQEQVDMVSAITMNYTEEAAGIAQAAEAVDFPVVISFTVETNGKLPDGTSLEKAITGVDESVTKLPLYYMINCAHPDHFIGELENGRNKNWTKRIRGIRANSSCKSHAELDEATELDRGNPRELGVRHKDLKQTFRHLNVFGGCCGTDEEHLTEIVKQVTTA